MCHLSTKKVENLRGLSVEGLLSTGHNPSSVIKNICFESFFFRLLDFVNQPNVDNGGLREAIRGGKLLLFRHWYFVMTPPPCILGRQQGTIFNLLSNIKKNPKKVGIFVNPSITLEMSIQKWKQFLNCFDLLTPHPYFSLKSVQFQLQKWINKFGLISTHPTG